MASKPTSITAHSNHAVPSILFVVSTVLVIMAGLWHQHRPAAISGSVETQVMRGYSGTWYQVYFTKPVYPESAANRDQGLDQAVVADIARAQQRVEVASYDLDLGSITDALVAARQRGIAVRVLIDDEHLVAPVVASVIGRLQDAGIEVVYDQRAALMHNKLVVVDNHVVWTGSWNLTVNDTFRNNNSMLRVANAQFAALYQNELELLYTRNSAAPAGRPTQPVLLAFDAASVNPLFAPDDPIIDRIVAQIEVAQHQIDVMVFTFTSDRIADALVAARNRGVVVRVVIERNNVNITGSEFDRLQAAQVDVRPDGNCYNMHHKTLVVDGRYTVTGSFNFTGGAQDRNDENVLVVDDPALAALYATEFERVYDQARNPMRCTA